MAFRNLVLALCLGAAAAFAPAARPARSNTVVKALEDMPGAMPPTGVFDPWGLANDGNEETLLWYRAAELKHSRVAMLATAGWLTNAYGVSFPGDLSTGQPFSSLSHLPHEAWDAVPYLGKVQMLVTIGLIEFVSETKKPHAMKGGPMGLQCDPLGLAKNMSPEKLRKRQNSELANGRLAMIGIMSFFSASEIAGSVPALPTPY
jgi:hypothetical protein